MIRRFLNIFRVPELRNKVLFTLFMLAVYRLGYHIPLPAIDQSGFAEMAKRQSDNGDESVGGWPVMCRCFRAAICRRARFSGWG